jgi:hypothetical protein
VRYGNSSQTVKEGVNADAVKQLFGEWSPGGRTPTHLPVTYAVEKALKTQKPTVLILATDGGADDESALIAALAKGANKLGRPSTVDANGNPVAKIAPGIGFVFVQVGHDPHATNLMKRLDSGMSFPDCISTTRLEQVGEMSLAKLGFLAFNG